MRFDLPLPGGETDDLLRFGSSLLYRFLTASSEAFLWLKSGLFAVFTGLRTSTLVETGYLTVLASGF